MEQLNIKRAEKIVTSLRKYINGNKRLEELFTTQPVMKMEVYKNTSLFYANRKYEEYQKSDETIPHGFYAILEREISEAGFIKTYKKYQKYLKDISEIMNIPEKDLMLTLKSLVPQKNQIQDSLDQQNARNTLKEVIRKYTSIKKENFIKKIIDEKNILLEQNTKKIEAKKEIIHISKHDFIIWILHNPALRESIISVINQKFNKMVNYDQLKDILEATFHENYMEELKTIFGIKTPSSIKAFEANRNYTRLKKNYEPKLNEAFKNYSITDKLQIIKIIKVKARAKKLKEMEVKHYSFNSPLEKKQSLIKNQPLMSNEDFKSSISLQDLIRQTKEYRALINHDIQIIIEEVSTLLAESDCELNIINGKLNFDIENLVTKEQEKECREYKKKEKQISSFHNYIYPLYIKQNNLINQMVTKSPTPVVSNEDQYQINADIWFTEEKIKEAIDAVDKNKLINMTEESFKALKKFLIEDGFLWTFVADNIDLTTFIKIVNNFDSIKACMSNEEITIDNLHEIIRKANLYDYANDLIIGLVGQDITAKVINYNQFAETTITDETIHQRLRKLVDLAVRSEYVNTSSLPYRCNVQSPDGYSLQRYKNNDPQIFVSGVDTKTCFFISVNENDFFFYSLLNKNGYVIKILNNKNELIGRASCFRKNNVFMINGIRWKNNKIVAESKEDITEMKKAVDLFELLGKKLIELTKDDECPIDYIVCNKAGILENAAFEGKFEQINSDLFSEPINIYDDDWKDFIQLYDNEPEQMLQEVPHNGGRSFTTDFGNHYPALLLVSRNNMELSRPRHISYKDQPATYIRPRKEIEEYIGEEINEEILARINRIRALSCFTGTKEEIEYKTRNYKLLKNKHEIKAVAIGEDWIIMIREDNTYEEIFARSNQVSYQEAKMYMKNEKVKADSIDSDVKTYTLKSTK